MQAAGPAPDAVASAGRAGRLTRHQHVLLRLGELIADPARGLVYGNRGCLHDASGRIRRHHNGRRWIACRLRFRGWRRSPLLQPGRFTELPVESRYASKDWRWRVSTDHNDHGELLSHQFRISR